jgi:hypothetical protein
MGVGEFGTGEGVAGAFSLRRWRRSPLETSRGAEASLQGARFANTICLSSGARAVKGNVPFPRRRNVWRSSCYLYLSVS